MKYVLMNKNTPVIEVGFDIKGQYLSEIGKSFNVEYAPLGIVDKNKKIELEALSSWWEDRAVSDSRRNVENALNLLKKNRYEFIIQSLALSLSDQYWIKPIDTKIEWKDINFFTNNFSDEIGKLFFENYISNGNKRDYSSPDWTLNGTLDKKWIIRNDKRFLCKKGSEPFYQQPYNEVVASKLLKKLKCDNFVEYEMAGTEENPYSICENFIQENTEYIPATTLKKISIRTPKETEFDYFMRCCQQLKIKEIMQRNLDYIIPFDYLIGNVDRNYGNFGVIRNVETLKIIGVAPVFDNGNSLWYNDVLIKPEIKSYPFMFNQEEQIQYVKDKSVFPVENIAVLSSICKTEFSKDIRCSNERLGKMTARLNERCIRLKKKLKEQNLAIPKNTKDKDDDLHR